MKAKKSIYFLTGASGVGKSTLLDEFANKHHTKPWVFYHFDSIGVPSLAEMEKQFGSGENWQREMAFQWIERTVNEPSANRIFVEGQVNLEFIRDGFARHHFTDYQIILINCDEATMVHRLIHERQQPELADSDMRSWLAYLRNQAHQFGVPLIDTALLSKAEAVKELERIIENSLQRE